VIWIGGYWGKRVVWGVLYWFVRERGQGMRGGENKVATKFGIVN